MPGVTALRGRSVSQPDLPLLLQQCAVEYRVLPVGDVQLILLPLFNL